MNAIASGTARPASSLTSRYTSRKRSRDRSEHRIVSRGKDVHETQQQPAIPSGLLVCLAQALSVTASTKDSLEPKVRTTYAWLTPATRAMASVVPASKPMVPQTSVAASLPMFMATLDNLVVTNALPVLAEDLGASIEQLRWFINAHALSFASLILVAVALVVAPFAGMIAPRVGTRALLMTGMASMTVGLAWIARAMSPTTAYTDAATPALWAGVGALVIATALTFFLPAGRGTSGNADDAERANTAERIAEGDLVPPRARP